MAIDIAEITRLATRVSELASQELGAVSKDDVIEGQAAAAKLRRVSDALLARFVGEVDRLSQPDQPGGGLARKEGHKNTPGFVSRVTGGSDADARRLIDAGRAFAPSGEVEPGTLVDAAGGDADVAPAAPPPPQYPAVAAAQVEGELSVETASIIVSGLQMLGDHVAQAEVRALEQRLVEKAKRLTATEVRTLVKRAIARADERSLKERERRIHEERYLSWKEDHNGVVTLHAKLDSVTAAPIRAAIEQVVTAQFRGRRDNDPTVEDKRTVGQMRADALFDLCKHAFGCKETAKSGVRTSIVVRMSLEDLNTGSGVGTIDGVAQPVSVGELRRLAGDAGVIPAVLSGTSEVLDLGRQRRLFSPAQRLALLERDGGCARCHAPPEHCEAHHIRWWDRDDGPSDLSNGVMLCTRCHHDVHRYGWEILVIDNTVMFIPPGDDGGPPVVGGREAIELDPHDIVTNTVDRDRQRAEDEWARQFADV